MLDDATLLRRYATDRSESAMAELVGRHLNFVYAAALRQTNGDVHLAEDVTQTVFTDLARKAASLSSHSTLTGWLYTSTRFAVSKAIRGNRRRKQREQEAHAMQELNHDAGNNAEWDRIRPAIDEALNALTERDREAVLMRFFEGRKFPEVGARLSITADAARLRIERALAQMRIVLARRGLDSTTAALAVALSNQPAVAVPPGFMAAVATTAAAAGASVGGSAAAGTLGVFFAMSKIKIGITAAIAVAALSPVVLELRANRALKKELQETRAAGSDVSALRNESERLHAQLVELSGRREDQDELMRLRERAAVLKAQGEDVGPGQMKLASTWANVGRDTPEKALETFLYGMFTGNRELVASLITFTNDSAANRTAFMNNFSPAVRARYPTPEMVVAAALFPGNPEKSWDDAFKIVDIRPDERRANQVRVRFLSRSAGREREGGDRFQQTKDGWAIAPFELSDSFQKSILARIDPATGEPVRPRN